MPKLNENQQIGSDDAPFEVIQSVQNYEKFACQVVYGAGSGSSLKLQCSLNYNPDDESGDWTDIEGSDQTLDNAGGVHVWNVSDASYPWLKVVVEGDAVDVIVYFAGNPQPRRG